MSLDDLAAKVGATRPLLHYYESGKHKPRAEMALRLCAVLDLPADFFALPNPNPEPSPTFFRQYKSKVRVKQRNAIERLRLWLRDAVAAVETAVILPAANIPDFHPPSDPREILNRQIEEAAQHLRRYWGFGDGAFHEIIKLAENNGCLVVANLFGNHAEAIDAFSWWSYKGRPFIAVSCREAGGARRAMDVAHELGHLILHRNIDRRFLELSPETHGLIEKQAFRFAGAFLMPKETFQRSLPTVSLDSLALLKCQWSLSIQAMMQRARDLEMIDDASFVRLRKLMNQRGWTRREPGDEAIVIEQPRLLANALLALQAAGSEELSRLERVTGLYLREFAQYAGISAGELVVGALQPFQPVLRDGLAPSS